VTGPQRVTRQVQCAACGATLTVHLDRYHSDLRSRQIYVCPVCNIHREGTFPGRVVQVVRRWEEADSRPPPRVPLLSRYDPDLGPQSIGVVWTAKSRQLSMICTLLTHALGWEIRLTVRHQLIHSHVCRTEQEVFDTAEVWWADAIGKGWTDI